MTDSGSSRPVGAPAHREATARRRVLGARRDLAAIAETVEGTFVLHVSLRDAFPLGAGDVPDGTIDLRHGDALGRALAERGSVLVTGGGPYWGSPATTDERWAAFVATDPTRVELGASRLSGAYCGAQLHGPATAWFRDGTREVGQGEGARLTYADGSTTVIERTSLGYRTVAEPRHRGSLDALLRLDDRLPVRITSGGIDREELVRALVAAGRLAPARPEIDGAFRRF